YDSQFLIQAAIIHYFNHYHYETLQITSGESRDSNIYSDGFLHEQSYLKLTHQDIPLAESLELHIFGEDAPASFFKDHKAKKQQLELAASLFSLREYFHEVDRDKEWGTFIDKLKREWSSRNKQTQIKDVFVKNIDQVNKKVNDWFKYKQEHLASVTLPEHSPLTGKAKDRDQAVRKMNECYEEHLLEVARLHHRLQEKKKAIIIDLQSLSTHLAEAKDLEAVVKHDQEGLKTSPNSKVLKLSLATNEKDLAKMREDYKELQQKLRLTLKDRVQLINELQ